MLVNLRKLLRIGHTGREGKQRQPRLLAEDEHMIPAGFIRFAPGVQLRRFVDFMQCLAPFAFNAKTHLLRGVSRVFQHEPHHKATLADGR